MEVVDHEHVILSSLSLAFVTSGQTKIQRKLDNWPDELPTPINVSYDHPDLLLYEVI